MRREREGVNEREKERQRVSVLVRTWKQMTNRLETKD